MQFNEVSQNINPIKESKKEININEIENFVLSHISSTDTRNITKYEFYSVKNRTDIITDFINNLEHLYKEKNITNSENNNNINKIFSTIKLQLEILENISIDKLSYDEIFVVFSAIYISYLKKNIANSK